MLILIPAAGASSRMRGRDKLLEMVDGQPMLARQAGMAARAALPVLFTLPADRPDRAAALRDLNEPNVQTVMLPDALEGMSVSIRAGASHALKRGATGLMILPADMPEIEAGDVMQMIRAFDGNTVLRATDAGGTPGHPVIFPARLFSQLEKLTGDTGARNLLTDEQVSTLPLSGTRATTDLDTPEDWAAWRRRTGR